MKSVSTPDDQRNDRTGGVDQRPGDGRRRDGVRRDVLGIAGALFGLNGETRRALWVAWACVMGLTGLVIGLNIIAGLQRSPANVAGTVVDELTSLAALAVAYSAPAALAIWLRRARPNVGPTLIGIGLGFPVFTAVHIGGCEALRAFIEIVVLRTSFSPGMVMQGLPFEVAKDVLAYVAALIGFVIILKWRLDAPIRLAGDDRPEVFDIRDGGRLIRVDVADILAVRSAGNYAEFLLGDGRRPLMRVALATLQTRFTPLGFVRTHRSWMVNAARVTGLKPQGSGDYSVELGALEAPLSRRFPKALAALRSGQVGQSGRGILTG